MTPAGGTVPGTALLERETESELIRAALRDVAAGVPRLLVLRGTAGIGRTSLLDRVAAAAEAGRMTVGITRCSDLERDEAFGTVRRLFGPLVARAGAGRAALLAGAAGLAGAVLDPAGDPAAPGSDREPDPGYPALHGLYWLLANLCAGGPVALLVDDAQWADRPSLRALEHVARRLDGLPVLLAVATTDGEEPVDADLLTRIATAPGVTTLQPRPLTGAAVARLVRAELPDADDEVCAACARVTGGNPLLLRLLVRALLPGPYGPGRPTAADVAALSPPEVARLVLRQVGRQSPDALRLVRALALLGAAADPRTAAELAGMSEAAAAAATAPLLRLGLVEGPRLRLVHPLVAAAVAGAVDPAERARAHVRAARLLEAAGAPLEEVAAHLLRTHPDGDGWVTATLRAAGRAALAQGAPEQAVTYLERAEREGADPERAALLAELGTAELHTDTRAAAAHLGEALLLTDRADEQATLALRRGQALAASGDTAGAVDVLRDVSARLRAAGSPRADEAEAEAIFLALQSPRTMTQVSGPLAALDRDLDALVAAGPAVGTLLEHRDPAMLATMAVRASWRGRPRPLVAELCRYALGKGPAPADGTSIIPLYTTLVLAGTGDLDSGLATFDDALRGARRRGSLWRHAMASWLRSQLLVMRGDIQEAAADAELAVEALRPPQWGMLRPMAVISLIDPQLERGETDAAVELVEREGLSGDLPELWVVGAVLLRRARLRRARGEGRRALADILEVRRRVGLWGVDNPGVVSWRPEAALTLHGLGESERAREVAAEELTLAERWGAPHVLGRALRVAGAVAGPGADGVRLTGAAVEELEPTAARLELARAYAAHGTALWSAGDERSARDRLRQGWELAERCGAVVLAHRTHEELLARGGRPRRHSRTGPAALTPAERRVAALAARGDSNRQMALELFVTERTVEIHLTSTYRKLGISGRSQLQQALAAAAPGPG